MINIFLTSLCIGFISFIGCCISKNDYIFNKAYIVGAITTCICFVILLTYYTDPDVNSFSFFYSTGAYQF